LYGTGKFLEECIVHGTPQRAIHGGGLWIATPPFFVFEAPNVPWEVKTEKTGTVNYTVEYTLLPRI